MPDASRVVRAFFERMQARDWDAAGQLLDPDVEVQWPVTGERFRGPAFLEMQRAYPEGWRIEVVEVLGDTATSPDVARVAARVAVDQSGERFWCFGFYTVTGSRIRDAVELWGTEDSEPPPQWRLPYRS